MKKYLKYLLAFLIPFISFNIFLLIEKIGFFGDKTLLISDLKEQYSVFLSYIRDFESIFYSFNKGLGGGMFGTFAYYLSSPFNLIIFLFSKNNLPLAIALIITLKISLSGFTMYIYLKNKLNKDDYILLIFSSCYALMSYIINYYFNIMWLDGVMWLPIVMLGIEKLIHKNSSILYIISLSIAIISNYYIGYMLCIMSVLYFISQIMLSYDLKKDKIKILNCLKHFIISSILSGMISSIIIVPAFLELKNSYKMSETIHLKKANLNIIDFMSRFYLGSQNYKNILCVEKINIYCGLVVLPLIYFYFINKEISKKEKIINGTLILILISGYFIPQIDFIFHAFNNVTGFYYRYSFMIVFVLIMISTKSLFKIHNLSKIHYYTFVLIYIFGSFIIIFRNYSYLSNIYIYCSLGLIIIYVLLLYNLDKDKLCKIMLIILVFSELTLNIYLSLDDYNYVYKNTYNKYTFDIKGEIIKENNYRFELNPLNTRNDGLLLGYKGITSFISTNNYKAIKFLLNSGYWGSDMTVIDHSNNSIIMDSLLSIKYKISDKNIKYYEKENNYLLNNNALSIGYLIKDNLKLDDSNPFEFQNSLLNSITGNNDKYFNSYEIEKNKKGYEFKINNNELIYVYYPFNSNKDCIIYIDDKQISNDSEIFPYKDNLNGETINIYLKCDNNEVGGIPSMYYLDYDKVKKALNSLDDGQLNIKKIEDTYLKGTINVSNNNTLLLTIPYEKGFTLYVDGKEKEIIELFDTFIGVKLEKGRHIIELKYRTPGLNFGLIISTIGMILSIIYLKNVYHLKISK